MSSMPAIYDIIRKNGGKRPEKTALVFGKSRLSYAELLSLAERVARALHEIGIGKHTHFALSAHNSPEYALLMLAAAKLGAVIVPLPPGLKGAAGAIAIKTTECTHLIAPQKLCISLCDEGVLIAEQCIALERIEQLCAADEGNEYLSIPYSVEASCDYIITMTSGSTGHPKPIVFTQETKLVRAFTATRDVYGLDEESVVLTATPMHHSLAQRSTLLPLLLGGTGVILPNFTPAGWVEAVEGEKVTFLFAVSNQLEILLGYMGDSSCSFPSLKSIVSSSALLKDAVKERLVRTFSCDIDECYGASEIGVATNISINSRRDKLGSVGVALPHVSVKITDAARNTVPTGEVGEIACKTLTRFSRYYNNPDATAHCFDDEGYFYTGDLGYLDDDGYLYYRGRNRDVIITGGINIYPQDIEEVIAGLPEMAECAVIGVEDSYFGEAMLAILVPKEGCTIPVSAVMQRCAAELAEYQQPLAYEILSVLPRNPMGKLMKEVLREQFRGYDATLKLRTLLKGGGETGKP